MKRSIFLLIVCGLVLLLAVWLARSRDAKDRSSSISSSALQPPGADTRNARSGGAAPTSTALSTAQNTSAPSSTGIRGGSAAIPSPSASASIESTNPPPTINPPFPDRSPSGVPPPPTAPHAFEGDSAAAALDLEKINLMLRDYRTRMGENPIGTNAEIMKAIIGGNPKGAKLGPPEGMSLNGNGELIDGWGTPFFFHQLSGTHMEVRSAGPDRIMWTSDDVVQK